MGKGGSGIPLPGDRHGGYDGTPAAIIWGVQRAVTDQGN